MTLAAAVQEDCGSWLAEGRVGTRALQQEGSVEVAWASATAGEPGTHSQAASGSQRLQELGKPAAVE